MSAHQDELDSLPTLGPQLTGIPGQSTGWLQQNLVFGPGALNGKAYAPTLEFIAFLWRAYALWPQGHAQAGRRAVNEALLSRSKGVGKTELGGAVIGAEFAGGPVRCDGFDANGQPVGIPVFDPEVICIATTGQQAKDLAYTRARQMLTGGPLADQIDDGEEVCFLANAPGKMYLATSKAASKDGYIPTHANADEPHLFTSAELHELYDLVHRNLDKRAFTDDPWMLLTSTAYGPGEGSVAEEIHKLFAAIAKGLVKHDTGVLFDHLEAAHTRQLEEVFFKDPQLWTDEDDDLIRAAFIEASGDAASFRDVERFLRKCKDPRQRRKLAALRRYWLNQIVKLAGAWLHPDDIAQTARAGARVRRRETITLGFDGSNSRDSTALMGCRASDGLLFVIDVWERPDDAGPEWRVPTAAVDRAVRRAFREFDVALMVCDDPNWKDYIDRWSADFGEDTVIRFDTRQERRMSKAVERLQTLFETRRAAHDGDERLVRHLENARTRAIGTALERASDNPPVVICKETEQSENVIDLAIASVLAAHGLGIAKSTGRLSRGRRRGARRTGSGRGGLTFH